MNSNEFFSRTNPLRLFFIAIIPGAISMLAASVYAVFEGAFLGKFIGESAIAALSVGFPFVFLNFSLADLVGVGSSVPISVSLGKGDTKRACNIFTCALVMIFLSGVLMGSVLYFFSPKFVALVGAKGVLAEWAVKYIRVCAICSPVTTVVFATDNFLRICGAIRGSMWLNVFMSGLTIGLQYIFLGVMNMDIAGAALASCMAMGLCAVIALYPFLRKKMLLRLVMPKFHIADIKEIVFCGTPAFLNNVAGRVTSIAMNSALLHFGAETGVAIYGILMYANELLQPLLYGICDSVTPAIGYNWGAGNIDRVKRLIKYVFVTCAAISAFATAITLVFPQPIVSLFIREEQMALLSQCADALKVFCVAYILRWFGLCAQLMFNAIEKYMPAIIISVANALVFPLMVMAMLWRFELTGLYLNFAVTGALVSLLSLAFVPWVLKDEKFKM